MNESQLKAFVRQAFRLQDTADTEVLKVDKILGRVMLEVRRLVETLPEEGLLRNKQWRDIKELVETAMAPYAQGLREAVMQQEIAAAPEMKAYAIREAELTGANITNNLGAPAPANVIAAVERTKIGKKRFRQLFMPKQGPISPWVEGMFNVVNKKVQTGIIQGMTTKQIADEVVHETISRGVPGVTLQGNTSARLIRQQAMAMARTVSADVQHQIKSELWKSNPAALVDLEFEWTAALDSKTCQTCAPLDNKRFKTEEEAYRQGLSIPIHVNCRCQLVLIDPEDPFWDEDERYGQQIKPMYEQARDSKGKPIYMANGKPKMQKTDPFKVAGAYATPVKIKGEMFWRRIAPLQGSKYADYLAASNRQTQTMFFGGGPIGKRRAQFFRNELDRMNKDPQQILADMLTGPTNSRRFIPLP